VIRIDHPFITNKWRIDLSMWRIITRLATLYAHPRALFAAVEQVPLLAAARDLLPYTKAYGGLHTPFAVIQIFYCSSLYSESHNKMALPSLSAQLNYLSLCRHNYMFRQLTTTIGSSIQYFELRSTAVQCVQGVGYHTFTVIVCNCVH